MLPRGQGNDTKFGGAILFAGQWRKMNHVVTFVSQETRDWAGETNGRFGGEDSLGQVHEHGILLTCTPHGWSDARKPPPSTAYWVVGYVVTLKKAFVSNVMLSDLPERTSKLF